MTDYIDPKDKVDFYREKYAPQAEKQELASRIWDELDSIYNAVAFISEHYPSRRTDMWHQVQTIYEHCFSDEFPIHYPR